MAGKHRSKDTQGYAEHILVRTSSAMKADLEDAAASRGISINQEINNRLMVRPQRPYMTKQMREKLMALEPKPDDPRTDQEIAREMGRVQGEYVPPAKPEDEFGDIEIEWMAGTVGPEWNKKTDKVPDQEAQPSDERADELRSRMYKDREFMAGIRQGWEEGLRGKGVSVKDYING